MVTKDKVDLTRKRLVFLAIMVVLGAVFAVAYLALNGNAPQVYTDIVSEYTAIDASNKSPERLLIYILSIGGSLAYALYYFWSRRRYKGADAPNLERGKSDEAESGYKTLMLLIIMMTGVYYFVYQGTAPILIASLFCMLLVGIKDQSQAIPVMAFLWLAHYAIFAAYRIYVLLGGRKPIGMVSVTVWASALTIALLFYRKWNGGVILRGILLCQFVMPFLLLLYTMSNYKYNGTIVSLHTPYKVWAVILLLIFSFVAEAAYKIYKNWDHCESVGKCISFGTCASIMAFNRFSGSGAILSDDLHHPFEEIIAYSQIVELGQKPFSEYIPVSGLYSFVNGAFFKFFGNGSMEYWSVSRNVMQLLVVLVIVALLMAQLKREYVLLISFLFSMINSSRVTYIVPIALLLFLPALIRRKNLWLQAWFVTSFLYGLYYPVNGAAVCLAFLPLGIWQVVTFYKTGDLKKEIGKWSFWIGWAACIIPVIAGIPMLAGTLKHMLAMGGQTIYADGISRFGQTLPSNFFSYINSTFVRLALYYAFTFLILACIVWVSVALCLKFGNFRIENRKIKADAPVPAFQALGIGIMLLISLSYNFVRLEINNLYSRSQGLVYAVFVLLVLFVGKYGKSILGDTKYLRYVILGFAIFIISIVSGEGFKGNDGKLVAYYTVPEGYVAVEDDMTGRLGDCYMEKVTYEEVKCYYEIAKTLDREKSYLGVLPRFGYYYLYGIKGASVIETLTIKGYNAAKETVDLLRKNNVEAISSISTHNYYYLYHYALTSGEYEWNPQMKCFEKAEKGTPKEQVLENNRLEDSQGSDYRMGRVAGSWGMSMESLSSIFTDPEIKYSISASNDAEEVVFENPLYGDDADFMYVEFKDMDQNYQYILFDHINDIVQEEDSLANLLMKKDYNRGVTVKVSWVRSDGDVDTMECSMCQGKLLIPLGARRGWLLNEHDKVGISVLQDGQAIEVPEISNIRFLKLREVK